MASFARPTCLAFFVLSTATAESQPPATTPTQVNIVRPGAPGQSSQVISAAAVNVPARALSQADISFMQGMIMHHSQAVEMTELLRTRGYNKELLELGKRISISQTDEIKYMKQWLEERGKPIDDMSDMKGMDHMSMADMPAMPGMLTPAQMQALSKAKGAKFDQLFLSGMIQHHTGALIMVKELFDTPGAGQDNVLFDFATDVDNTQRAEIKIMQTMLTEKR